MTTEFLVHGLSRVSLTLRSRKEPIHLSVYKDSTCVLCTEIISRASLHGGGELWVCVISCQGDITMLLTRISSGDIQNLLGCFLVRPNVGSLL